MIDLIKEYSNYYVSMQETQKYEILDNIKDDCCVIDIMEIAIKKYMEKYKWITIRDILTCHHNSYNTYLIRIINKQGQYTNCKNKEGSLEIDHPYSKFKTEMNYFLDKLREEVSKILGHEIIGYKVEYD